ncbi:TRAP transporter small permease subunit [Acuticoccus sp. I52.16.1]|uniref:TRAP transporter small permease subunit n=1 Tax=Acuticoccus sp. I52.16.1 TaxID=2928472 RepID=UPI001FD4384F|nr:TRAP transporter small permease subunit [Acuticoccus sp. I52.16.1]UOM35888.1 TRAP transporter small permease subunit [Acuticoccus sp. I52.16.1]
MIPAGGGAAPRPLLTIAARLDRVNRIVGAVVAWAAVAMVLVQFAVVVARHVFGVSDIAANESVLYLHAALFMLGAGYAYLVDAHVRVDIFYAKLPRRGRAAVDIAGSLVFLFPALGLLLYWTWPTVRRSWAILEGPISVGGIPASFLLKSLIPAFCVLLAIQGVARLLRDIAALSAPAEAPAPAPPPLAGP